MKDIVVGLLVMIQKLLNSPFFWIWVILETILHSKPEILTQIFNNIDGIKTLFDSLAKAAEVLVGVYIGRQFNKDNK